MNRIILGAVGALLLAAVGLFWWQGRAQLEKGAPPPDISASRAASGPVELPTAGAHGRGPGLPGAGKATQTTEQKRFNRFDKNHDGRITRNEMLSTRVAAFKKLDVNHDNLLTFEEWAVKTANRFKEVDRNGDGIITRDELDAYYAAQDAKKAERAKERAGRCACAPDGPAGKARATGKPPADDDEDQ